MLEVFDRERLYSIWSWSFDRLNSSFDREEVLGPGISRLAFAMLEVFDLAKALFGLRF